MDKTWIFGGQAFDSRDAMLDTIARRWVNGTDDARPTDEARRLLAMHDDDALAAQCIAAQDLDTAGFADGHAIPSHMALQAYNTRDLADAFTRLRTNAQIDAAQTQDAPA